MRLNKFALTLATLAFAFPVLARDFNSSDIYPSDYPTVRAVAYMGDLMRERSGGRLILSKATRWASCAMARSTWRGSIWPC